MKSTEALWNEIQFADTKDQLGRLLDLTNQMAWGKPPPRHTHVDTALQVQFLQEYCPGVDPEPLLAWHEAMEHWRLTGSVPSNLQGIKLRARAILLLLLNAMERRKPPPSEPLIVTRGDLSRLTGNIVKPKTIANRKGFPATERKGREAAAEYGAATAWWDQQKFTASLPTESEARDILTVQLGDFPR